MSKKDYSDHNQLFHKSYTEKLNFGIIEQKRKFDACIHWLLTINGALLGFLGVNWFNFRNPDPVSSEYLVAICAIGLLWTWMIMLRSASAYRQLVNFDLILSRFNDYYLTAQGEGKKKLEADLAKFMAHFDYSHAEGNKTRCFKIKPWSSIWKHLRSEYGPIITIYSSIIIYNLFVHNDWTINLIVGFLLFWLFVTYFSIFHKKEKSLADTIASTVN